MDDIDVSESMVIKIGDKIVTNIFCQQQLYNLLISNVIHWPIL